MHNSEWLFLGGCGWLTVTLSAQNVVRSRMAETLKRVNEKGKFVIYFWNSGSLRSDFRDLLACEGLRFSRDMG